MARLVLKGGQRKLLLNGTSLYMLVEFPIAKVMGLDENTVMNVELYWSEKHKGHYIAAYPSNGSKGK